MIKGCKQSRGSGINSDGQGKAVRSAEEALPYFNFEGMLLIRSSRNLLALPLSIFTLDLRGRKQNKTREVKNIKQKRECCGGRVW